MSLHQVVYPALPKLAPVWGLISTRAQSVTVELNRSDGPTTLHAEIFAMPRRVHFDIYLAFLPSWRAEGTVIARSKDGTVIDILRLCRLALRHDTYDECHVP